MDGNFLQKETTEGNKGNEEGQLAGSGRTIRFLDVLDGTDWLGPEYLGLDRPRLFSQSSLTAVGELMSLTA